VSASTPFFSTESTVDSRQTYVAAGFSRPNIRKVLTILSAVLVGGAILWAGTTIAQAVGATQQTQLRHRTMQLLGMFTPGMVAAASDPRELLVWQPLAVRARKLFPDEFAALDQAAVGTFPFTRDQLQAAHSRWTTDWLAWEQAHDAEFKLKAAAAQHDLGASGGSAVLRAKVDAVEREKLETYQRRYEEYVRVAKGLQSLLD
jgi:hypothetical protein